MRELLRYALSFLTGGQKELLKLHFLGNEGLQQWFLLTPMAKQSISDNFNVFPTIFDRTPVILRNFFMGKSSCVAGSPEEYF